MKGELTTQENFKEHDYYFKLIQDRMGMQEMLKCPKIVEKWFGELEALYLNTIIKAENNEELNNIVQEE